MSRVTIKNGCDTLVLCNEAGKGVDEKKVIEQIKKIHGIEKITSLDIYPSSRLTNLKVIRAIPNLEIIRIFGAKIKSLDGLEWFRKGVYIVIDTARNKKRNIEKIADTKISSLKIRWANRNDTEAIGRCCNIEELELRSCQELSLQKLRNVPIKDLIIANAGFEEFCDAGYLQKLERLHLYNCRKLLRFKGDNGEVSWITVEACKQIDLKTLNTFKALNVIWIMNVKNGVNLSSFLHHKSLREVFCQDTQVSIDVKDLKSTSPKLERILIAGIKKDQLIELSRINSDVRFSSGRVGWYQNGELIEKHTKVSELNIVEVDDIDELF